jgi:hypothetical protein
MPEGERLRPSGIKPKRAHARSQRNPRERDPTFGSSLPPDPLRRGRSPSLPLPRSRRSLQFPPSRRLAFSSPSVRRPSSDAGLRIPCGCGPKSCSRLTPFHPSPRLLTAPPPSVVGHDRRRGSGFALLTQRSGFAALRAAHLQRGQSGGCNPDAASAHTGSGGYDFSAG